MHTPGPWEYFKAQNYDGFAIAPKGLLPTLAACERFGHKMTIECFNFPGETEANACLISAAPDLLEACKLILSGYDNPDNDGSFDWPEAAEILRKAIAKAEVG